jgi:homoserine O-acetyltransferase/O-succinyltransferase
MEHFDFDGPFFLEEGGVISGLTITYHTYGTLNESRDNIIWICHALTANSDVEQWWPGMVGAGRCFDTDNYFVICANIIGSCYGTTGPLTNNPQTGSPYFNTFPFITIKDMVRAHSLLARHLGIQKIQLLAGGSMGGYQVLEWCLYEPNLIAQIFLITTSAKESAWGKAIHAAQRLAIEADATWHMPTADAGKKGLKAARAIGMITYRNYATYEATQEDEQTDDLKKNKASSYIEYQGNKFIKRFNAYSYWYLNHAMDTHHLARGRNKTLEAVLQTINQKALIIGINSDILCPVQEQEFLAKWISKADFITIDSLYGHDGFLVETEKITRQVKGWMHGLDAALQNK